MLCVDRHRTYFNPSLPRIDWEQCWQYPCSKEPCADLVGAASFPRLLDLRFWQLLLHLPPFFSPYCIASPDFALFFFSQAFPSFISDLCWGTVCLLASKASRWVKAVACGLMNYLLPGQFFSPNHFANWNLSNRSKWVDDNGQVHYPGKWWNMRAKCSFLYF